MTNWILLRQPLTTPSCTRSKFIKLKITFCGG